MKGKVPYKGVSVKKPSGPSAKKHPVFFFLPTGRFFLICTTKRPVGKKKPSDKIYCLKPVFCKNIIPEYFKVETKKILIIAK